MQYRSLVLNIEFWDLGSPDSRQKTVTVTLYSKNPLNTFNSNTVPYKTERRSKFMCNERNERLRGPLLFFKGILRAVPIQLMSKAFMDMSKSSP